MLSLNPFKIFKKTITGEYFTFNWGAAVAAGVNAWSARQGRKGAEKMQQRSIELQRELAGNSLAEQKRQYDIGQENLAPYREAGQQALGEYQGMLGDYTPGELPDFQGQYQDPGAFQGVTNLQEDPGYQFRLSQGLQALDRMSSRGGERYSGKRGIALQDYGQQSASQEYGAAFSRSLQKYGVDVQRADSSYGRDMGKYSLDYQKAGDVDKQRRGQLSMYANLAATGQQAAGASSTLGANYGAQVGNTNANLATGLAQSYTNLGNIQMAGSLGVGNAVTGGIAAYNYNQGQQSGYDGRPNYNTNYSQQSGSGSQGSAAAGAAAGAAGAQGSGGNWLYASGGGDSWGEGW